MGDSSPAAPWRASTLWERGRSAPMRAFLQTESGSAGVLVAAVAMALLWANIDSSSYDSFWHTELSIRLGSTGPSYDLREWVNSGLMTFFFLVVGLETRREFDLGDLRERRRFLLPFAVGLVGMAVPVLIFLAFNAGRSERARVGHRDVDRHGAGARAAGADRSRRPGPGPGVPGDGLRRRRPRRAGRDRGRLQRRPRRTTPRAGGARVRCPAARGPAPDAAALAVPRPRSRHLVGADGQRRGPAGGGVGDRAGRPGVHPEPRRPRAGDRPGTRVPGGADARARPVRLGRPDPDPVAERPAPGVLPPVDELRDRPAVRPLERRHRAGRRVPGACVRRASDPRCARRLRRRQAGGRGRRPPGSSRGSAAAGCGRRWGGRR